MADMTFSDREAIASIVDKRVAAEYGDMYNFKWSMKVSGHFQIQKHYEYTTRIKRLLDIFEEVKRLSILR